MRLRDIAAASDYVSLRCKFLPLRGPPSNMAWFSEKRQRSLILLSTLPMAAPDSRQICPLLPLDLGQRDTCI